MIADENLKTAANYQITSRSGKMLFARQVLSTRRALIEKQRHARGSAAVSDIVVASKRRASCVYSRARCCATRPRKGLHISGLGAVGCCRR